MMRELRQLVATGESNTLELKRSTGQLNAAGKTLCAFLDAAGGKVVFGVADDGKVVGQAVSDKTRRESAVAPHSSA